MNLGKFNRVKRVLFLVLISLALTACSTKGSQTIENKKYTTKYSLKNKRLWAKSFIGKKAPEFVVENWFGEKPEFKKDKFLLIDFWGIYCKQCKKSIPKLNRIHRELKDQLTVVGVSDHTLQELKAFTKPKIEFYSASDPKRRLKKAYGVRAIPHVVIIAPNQTVVWEGYPLLKEDYLNLEKVKKIINQH